MSGPPSNIRRKRPAHVRTASKAIATGGIRKTTASPKDPSRSGSVRPTVDRESFAGPSAQHQKSEENVLNMHNASCAAGEDSKVIPLRVSSKTRNEIVPMHDSSNNSALQPISSHPTTAEIHYTDRFGHAHPPVTVDLAQTSASTTISSKIASAENVNTEQQAKTHSGVVSEPTTTKGDGPKSNEVCRKFLTYHCLYGRRCHRLHPVEMLRPRQKVDEVCRDFMKGHCYRTGYCNRIHPPPDPAKLDDSVVSTSSNPLPGSTGATNTDRAPTNKEGRDDTACITDTKTPVLVPADVRNDGTSVEIKCVEQPLGASIDTESRPQIQCSPTHHVGLPLRPKEVCRLYLIDRCEWDRRCHRFHPPEAERLQLLEVERSRQKLSQVCQSFLRGRCHLGVLCNYTHARPDDVNLVDSTVSPKTYPLQNTEVPGKITCPSMDTSAKLESTPVTQKIDEGLCATGDDQDRNGDNRHSPSLPSTSVPSIKAALRQDVQSSVQPLSTSNGTSEIDSEESMHKTDSGRTTSKPRKVCKRYLNGIKHNKRYCHYFHAPSNQQRTASVKEQVVDTVTPAIPVDAVENSSDCDTSSAEQGLFTRSLLDTSSTTDTSCTTDTPLVNMLKANRSSNPASRHKMKIHDPGKVSPSSPMMKEDTTAVLTDKVLFDYHIPVDAPVGYEVVKLPSSQMHSSFPPGSGDNHNYPTEQVKGGVSGQTLHINLSLCAEPFTAISNSGPYATGEPTGRSQLPPSKICIDQLLGRCMRDNCKYLHTNQPGSRNHSQVNKRNGRDFVKVLSIIPPQVHLAHDQHVPPHPNRCKSVLPLTSVPVPSTPVPPREPPSHITVTVMEHTKINLGAGFQVQEVTTGFESRWVILGNIPSCVTEKTIRRTLDVFGQVDDLKMPVTTSNTSAVNIKALFSSSAEAIQAAGALNGAQLFSRTISARLPLNNTMRGNGILQDCSVRIEWDAPGRTGYAGYPDLEEAEAAVSMAKGFILRDSCVTATIYEGLPSLGAVNVRFAGLPPTADAEDLEKFGAPETVTLERSNYMSVGLAAKSIQGLLSQVGEVQSFDLPPPPYRDRKVRAWAHFASPTLAQTAATHLNGRKPFFIGKGILYARHVKTISYTLPAEAYDKLASDIFWLRQSFWRRDGAVISVVDRRAHLQQDSALPVFIKLSGEDVGSLGLLKAEFEKVLHGEILMQDGKVIWDGFLERSTGSAFLYEVERAYPNVSIQKSIGRRTITLFGPISERRRARNVILNKINRIRAQKTWEIPLAGRLIGIFMNAELMALQQSLGHENVILNLMQGTLTIRGSESAYEAAQRAVHQVQERHPEHRKGDLVECPVCFNQVVSPITLQCGHSWCKSCLSNYFVASTDNKIFPLRCLGAEATCSQPIPVAIAREILSANEFDAVVNTSFLAYIHARPDEFHYCPTPDCPQIYRNAPPDSILQCPSCLTRICPSCHVEAHDGLTCAVRDVAGEKLFKEWVDAHDAKPCPGCKAVIERVEGCNHMTCSRCQTHICWVCTETFPKGEGIYDHMRTAHGGIGL